jgi:hypothetical protein
VCVCVSVCVCVLVYVSVLHVGSCPPSLFYCQNHPLILLTYVVVLQETSKMPNINLPREFAHTEIEKLPANTEMLGTNCLFTL